MQFTETAPIPPASTRTPMPQRYASLNNPPTVIKSNASMDKEITQSGENYHSLIVHTFIDHPSYMLNLLLSLSLAALSTLMIGLQEWA